jgi:two-component system, OmpR family, KDP operon response regulator KdpE
MIGTRVLIVDDEAPIRRVLRTTLLGHGYAVETADDGAAALATIAAHPPEVIVLDLVMPGIDGFEVLRQIRAWSQVPVIVLSDRSEERDKVKAFDLGADDYLTKPFGMGEFLARLRAVLRRASTSEEPNFSVGDVAIDFARHVITRSGLEIHLTPTEYNLLRVLAKDADKVLTHSQLLERVWGGHAVANTLQLRVYINYLRRKLEPDPTHPRLIVTELGVGYRLKADPTMAKGSTF